MVDITEVVRHIGPYRIVSGFDLTKTLPLKIRLIATNTSYYIVCEDCEDVESDNNIAAMFQVDSLNLGFYVSRVLAAVLDAPEGIDSVDVYDIDLCDYLSVDALSHMNTMIESGEWSEDYDLYYKPGIVANGGHRVQVNINSPRLYGLRDNIFHDMLVKMGVSRLDPSMSFQTFIDKHYEDELLKSAKDLEQMKVDHKVAMDWLKNNDPDRKKPRKQNPEDYLCGRYDSMSSLDKKAADAAPKATRGHISAEDMNRIEEQTAGKKSAEDYLNEQYLGTSRVAPTAAVHIVLVDENDCKKATPEDYLNLLKNIDNIDRAKMMAGPWEPAPTELDAKCHHCSKCEAIECDLHKTKRGTKWKR